MRLGEMIRAGWLGLVLTMATGLPLAAADLPPGTTLYVNNQAGNDAFDGLVAAPAGDGKHGPVATISKAISVAPVSAHIEIANTGSDYREGVSVRKATHGRAAAPLVIDGHGATISGLVKLAPTAWTLFKDDIYWFKNTLPDGQPGPMPNSNWLGFKKHQGWFTEPEAPEIFFLNGKAAPNVLTLAELPPGGFFYDTIGEHGPARCVYLRLPANAKIADVSVELPLNSGVFVDADYVVVRNLQSKYSQDDGFAGFWGYGDVFENINGSYNCDQGFSMHGNSVTVIDGALFECNGGMGIVDVMSSLSVYRNIVVRRNLIGGALLQGAFHSCRNSQFLDNAGSQVSGNRFDLENCLLRGGWQGVGVQDGRIVRCTIIDAKQGIAAGSGSTIEGCLVVNTGVPVAVAKDAIGRVKLTKNVLALGKLEWGGERIGPEQWEAFVQANNATVTGNLIATPVLTGPLYQVHADAPLRQAGDFGATVKDFTGWQPVD